LIGTKPEQSGGFASKGEVASGVVNKDHAAKATIAQQVRKTGP
jgi:hypothetical protein